MSPKGLAFVECFNRKSSIDLGQMDLGRRDGIWWRCPCYKGLVVRDHMLYIIYIYILYHIYTLKSSLFSLPESVMTWPMKSSKNAETKIALRPREVASCFPNLGLPWSTREYDRGGNIENKFPWNPGFSTCLVIVPIMKGSVKKSLYYIYTEIQKLILECL